MATHSSTLAWKTPWTEEPDGLESIKSKRIDTTEHAQGVCVRVCVCQN